MGGLDSEQPIVFTNQKEMGMSGEIIKISAMIQKLFEIKDCPS